MRGTVMLVQALTLPFRAIGWAIDGMGRLASLTLGFLLMVAGAALAAGPTMLVGAPLFLIGAVLTLRALG